MNRDEFLGRVRQATAAGRAYRVHVPPVGPEAGYVGAAADLCAALASEIQSVGGIPQVVDDWHAAQAAVLAWLQHYGVRHAICWQHPTLERLQLREALTAHQIQATGYDELSALAHDEQRRLMLNADIGITGVDYAVAETGTLAVCARPGQERSLSLVAPIHVAVVHQSQILPDLFDLFARWSPQSLPSNVALITGPSKTGDIELELTTGVHGPGHWHVVIVRESAPSNAENHER